MTNYCIKENQPECYLIKETQTDYIVRNCGSDKKKAKKAMRWFNSGGAFAGFTPEFFARHIPLTVFEK